MSGLFLGTVEISAYAFQGLLEAGFPVTTLVTLDKEKASRHSDYFDLKPLAQEHGIDVIEIVDINSPDTIEELTALGAEYLFVIGWSQLLRSDALGIASQGIIGFHPSKLPEGRGRAAIPWSILLELKSTAGTLFWIDDGVDTGKILDQRTIEISPRETAYTLYKKHCDNLKQMMKGLSWDQLAASERNVTQDQSRATYYGRRRKRDGVINWSRGAKDIDRLIRACGKPYPGAYTEYMSEEVIIWGSEPVEPRRYVGTPGQLHVSHSDQLFVSCADFTSINVTELTYKNQIVRGNWQTLFKTGEAFQ